jgi:hypothetical protein
MWGSRAYLFNILKMPSRRWSVHLSLAIDPLSTIFLQLVYVLADSITVY